MKATKCLSVYDGDGNDKGSALERTEGAVVVVVAPTGSRGCGAV